MRQQKQVHECPRCKAPMKRTIGAQSRRKYWECTAEECAYRTPVNAVTMASNPW